MLPSPGPTGRPTPGARPKRVAALNKALAILGALEASPGDVGLTRLAQLAGIDKGTCHRILATLAEGGMVERGRQPGTYRLGLRLLELGSAVERRLDLRDRAQPALARLAEQCGQATYLCVLSGERCLCIHDIPGREVQVMRFKYGETLPLHVGGAPRALLAALPDDRIRGIVARPLEVFTPNTATEPDEVWALVREIRGAGYALSHEDVTLGVAAIGATIHGREGRLLGAISVSGLMQRFTPEREAEFIRLVVRTAAEISEQMGGRVGGRVGD